MLRFPSLEDLGLSIAAMSEKSDGDCVETGPRRTLCETLGIAHERLALLRQVHGDTVLQAGSARREADGQVTADPALPLGVLVADCVPVFLFDPVTRAAGLVHAGRAGTYSGIVRNAVAMLEGSFGAKANDLRAVIAPSAGPCCYEVSEELARDFAGRGLPAEGRHLDLWQANALQLEACGVPGVQIAVAGICTICDGRFHSHRRNPDGRRNLAILSI